MRKRGGWLRALLRGGVRLLLVIAVAELCLRGYDWWVAGEQHLFERDEELGFRVRPNVQRIFRTRSDEAYLVETNSLGYRDSESVLVRDQTRKRVVLMGSSTPFGLGVGQDDIFPEVIETIHPSIEIVNLSLPGTALDQHSLLLQDEGLAYEPDLVLVMLTLLDARETFWPYQIMANKPKSWLKYDRGEIEIRPPPKGMLPRFLSSSFVSQRALQFGLSLLVLTGDTQKDTLNEEPFLFGQVLTSQQRCLAIRLLLQHDRKLCADRRIPYVVVYLPTPGEIKYPGGAEVARLREGVLKPMMEVDGVDCVDLLDVIERAWSIDEKIFEDDFHLNSRGHRVIAERLGGYLKVKLGITVNDGSTASPPTPATLGMEFQQ